MLLLLIWAAGLFATTRLRVTNLYFLPQDTSDKIVIVALDNASLTAYGRSPVEWNRTLYADLVTTVNEGGARVIAFDMLFAESAEGDEAFAAAILAARQGENARTRTIMPVSGVEALVHSDGTLRFQQHLQPQPAFIEVVDNLGYVNTLIDRDGSIRRQPTFIQVGDERGISFSLAAFMAYSSIPAPAIPQLLVAGENEVQITPELTPDRVLPVDAAGLWHQNYFGAPGKTFPTYSMQAVLEGNVNPAVFADKIVLVGLTNSTGLSDRAPVPLSINGEMMAGVEIQANALETLLQERPLKDQSQTAQALTLVLITLLASLFYSTLRRAWLLLPAMLGLLVAWLVITFVIFDTQQQVMNLFDTSLGILLPALATLVVNIRTETRRRQQTEFLLASVVALTEQQLALEKVLPTIAEDIQQIVRVKGGAIWLLQGGARHLAYQWADASPRIPQWEKLLSQVRQTSEIVDQDFIIPIQWQQQPLAYIVITPEQRVEPGALRLFNRLATRLAPGLAGTLLFDETQRQQNLLQQIFNASPDGILLLGENLHVRRSNLEAASILGYVDDQPLYPALAAAGLAAETQAKISKHFENGKPFREEIRLGQRAFTLAAVPLPDSQEWVAILSDVSALAELSDLKTQMIRMASHDLKNPLSRIMGYGELLQDTPGLGDSEKRYLSNMMKASEEMLTLINEILNLEQLRSGRLNMEPFDVAVTVDEVISRHMGDIQRKKQTLKTDIPVHHLTLTGDQRQIAQAFTNLIGNAVKYTPDDGTITVRLHTRDEHICFQVQDTGYGISQEAQAKLFTQFYRVRTAATAAIPGTGLGLSLVKSIIEAHHGRIWVESQEGVGSTFFVELPLTPTASPGTE